MNTQSIFPFQNRDQYDSKSDIKSQNSQIIMETKRCELQPVRIQLYDLQSRNLSVDIVISLKSEL